MTIEELEKQVKQLQTEIDKLKSEQSGIKPWRADNGSTYHYLGSEGNIHEIEEWLDENDAMKFSFGNYYHTKELAEKDRVEIRLRNKVRQLRDVLCEGYQPKSGALSYTVYYNTNDECFNYGAYYVRVVGAVWFDTDVHAQQACHVLNEELKNGILLYL